MYGISKCFGLMREHITINRKKLDLDTLDLFEGLNEETENLNDSGFTPTPTESTFSHVSFLKRKRKSIGFREMAKRTSKVISPINHVLYDDTNLMTPINSRGNSFVSNKVDNSVLSLWESENSESTSCQPPSTTLHVLDNKKTLTSIITGEMTALEKMLSISEQAEVVGFEEYVLTVEIAKKLGEGSFAEVFITKSGTIIKVMPFGGDLYNGMPQKSAEEVLPEIVINKNLSDLQKGETYRTDGFVQLIKSRVVRGCFPTCLVDMWVVFDEENESYNDNPELLSESQCFVVLELSNGGTPLEDFTFETYKQQCHVLTQLAFTLAVGEASYEFEHRDLHIANVLIFKSPPTGVVLKGVDRSECYSGHSLRTTIIDYTLSRIAVDGLALFSDLKDDDIFEGTGHIQYDVYRQMRDVNGNKWKPFEPKSNLLWLEYIGMMMLTDLKVEDSSEDAVLYKNRLVDMVESIPYYSSTVDWVDRCL